MNFKIEVITAFVAVDKDGDEGLIAWMNRENGQWMPLVCADEKRVASMYQLAVDACKGDDKGFKVIQFRDGKDVTEAIHKLYGK